MLDFAMGAAVLIAFRGRRPPQHKSSTSSAGKPSIVPAPLLAIGYNTDIKSCIPAVQRLCWSACIAEWFAIAAVLVPGRDSRHRARFSVVAVSIVAIADYVWSAAVMSNHNPFRAG